MSDKFTRENVNKDEQPAMQEFVPSKYLNRKEPLTSAIICFFIMVAFLGVQFVVLVPMMMAKLVGLVRTFEGTDQTALYDEMLKSFDTVGLSLIATVVSAAAAVIWYRLGYCRGFGRKELKKKCSEIFKVRNVLGIVCAAICLFYVSNFLLLFIEFAFPSVFESYNRLIEKSGLAVIDWRVIILAVILAPINEECIMRGIIFRNLKKNMAPVYAIVISAVYFGIFHLNIVQGLYAAGLGLVMAYYADRYDSIIASMLLHAVFNGFNYLMTAFPESIQHSIVLMFAVPIVTGVAWYYLDLKRKNKVIN